jgi:hypothetical protein
MSLRCVPMFVVLAVAQSLHGQQPKSQAKPEATASGVFVGRSGKPMAKARLLLAEVIADKEVSHARLKLSSKVAAAVADEQGRFQLKGFTPGSYAIVYQPAGASPVIPIDTYIKPLLAVDKSIAPLLRNMELGKLEPFADRAWGRDLTLLKGHTFWSEGEFMKIWNATVRRGQQGPYMEVRRGALRVDRLDDKSQIKMDAWSF